jgi:hypothetical protein
LRRSTRQILIEGLPHQLRQSGGQADQILIVVDFDQRGRVGDRRAGERSSARRSLAVEVEPAPALHLLRRVAKRLVRHRIGRRGYEATPASQPADQSELGRMDRLRPALTGTDLHRWLSLRFEART